MTLALFDSPSVTLLRIQQTIPDAQTNGQHLCYIKTPDSDGDQNLLLYCMLVQVLVFQFFSPRE